MYLTLFVACTARRFKLCQVTFYVLDFFVDPLIQAVIAGRRDLKFLVIYLHSPDHPETEPFCRYVMATAHQQQVIMLNRTQ